MSNINSALAISIERAIQNYRHSERPGKALYTPYHDKSGLPVVHRFPENPKKGSAVDRAKTAFETAIERTKAVPAAKKKIWDDPNLSDAGKKVALTKWIAENSASVWRKHWNAMTRERKALEERVTQLKLREADQSPAAVREREEIRARLFTMDDKRRNEFVQKYRDDSGSNVAAAIAERAPELSGINAVVHENVTAKLLDQQHASELAEIAEISEALGAAERAIVSGRDEAKKHSGINFQEYEKILSVVETQVDAEFEKQASSPSPAQIELPADEAKAVFEGVSKLSSKQRSDLLEFMGDILVGKKAA